MTLSRRIDQLSSGREGRAMNNSSCSRAVYADAAAAGLSHFNEWIGLR